VLTIKQWLASKPLFIYILRIYMLQLLTRAFLIHLMLNSAFVLADPQQATQLDAKFMTESCAKPCKKPIIQQWWMMRDNTQVELRSVDRKNQLDEHSEIWQFNPADGKMHYLYLMHDEKRVIEYQHEDMSLLQMSPSEKKWQEVSQLITDQDLALLKKSAKKSQPYFGKLTEIYTGKLNGTDVHLTWIPELKVPQQMLVDYAESRIKITLKSLGDTGEKSETAARSTESLLNTYSQVYFTDIGDMEQNAEDKVWIKKAHGAPGLIKHHH
jgi:hypothetical protein